MFFDKRNKIDKKITQIFPEEILKNLDPQKVDYFGINISSDPSKDFSFKIYYLYKYSLELYSKSKKNPFIDFLAKNKLMSFLTFVHDEKATDCSRYDAALYMHPKKKREAVFSYLKENCSFYNKYEKEILELSEMKVFENDDIKHASFWFVALLDDGKALKCHWYNRASLRDVESLNNEYYFNFIENSSVEGLKKILPMAKKAIQNCSGYMYMEGIDYDKFASQKHKIYIYEPENTFNGLIKTYSDNKELCKKLKVLKKWNDLHEELYCAGFAIGEDANNNSVINLYLRFKGT